MYTCLRRVLQLVGQVLAHSLTHGTEGIIASQPNLPFPVYFVPLETRTCVKTKLPTPSGQPNFFVSPLLVGQISGMRLAPWLGDQLFGKAPEPLTGADGGRKQSAFQFAPNIGGDERRRERVGRETRLKCAASPEEDRQLG